MNSVERMNEQQKRNKKQSKEAIRNEMGESKKINKYEYKRFVVEKKEDFINKRESILSPNFYYSLLSIEILHFGLLILDPGF